MSYLVLPDKSISLFHWGNSLKRSLGNLIIPTPPLQTKDWQKWARLIISINQLGSVPFPSTQTFPKEEDWRKWAWLFIKNYNRINSL